ncbi:hypothetical protein Pelo_10571 [Pelomyxa schiedti]|nr:hypothetical protein Pelo_10571 [Pelomyxa schiedti]
MNAVEVVKGYLESYNRHDVEGTTSHLDEGCEVWLSKSGEPPAMVAKGKAAMVPDYANDAKINKTVRLIEPVRESEGVPEQPADTFGVYVHLATVPCAIELKIIYCLRKTDLMMTRHILYLNP